MHTSVQQITQEIIRTDNITGDIKKLNSACDKEICNISTANLKKMMWSPVKIMW